MLFVCYPRCGTCRKAQKWMEEHGIAFAVRDIKEERPTEAELRVWQKKSALPLRRFFNTSGLKYKELGLSRKLDEMSDDEAFALLASDGMLVRRPILVTDERVLVGFREAEYETLAK